MLGPITRAVVNRGSSTVNASASRIAAAASACEVTSQPSRLGSHDTGSRRPQAVMDGVRIGVQLLERDRRAERERLRAVSVARRHRWPSAEHKPLGSYACLTVIELTARIFYAETKMFCLRRMEIDNRGL